MLPILHRQVHPFLDLTPHNQPTMSQHQLATVAHSDKAIEIFVGENETPNVVSALVCLSRADNNVK
jgi:hypothetical protein